MKSREKCFPPRHGIARLLHLLSRERPHGWESTAEWTTAPDELHSRRGIEPHQVRGKKNSSSSQVKEGNAVFRSCSACYSLVVFRAVGRPETSSFFFKMLFQLCAMLCVCVCVQVTAVYANADIYRDHTRSWNVGVSHRHHPSWTLRVQKARCLFSSTKIFPEKKERDE